MKDQSNNKPLFRRAFQFSLISQERLFYSVRFIKTNIVGETQSLFIMILTENRKLFEGILIKSR
ncbi:hypothetical protein DW075_01840 [Bacteroides xylanisolvens]|uniref:Uncharacterized protein n=1 Tax=Bacteroides xylanisolvens TaxID=371601 RepID=A0A412K1X3_9BACE|nr:hypothetical protein DWX88_04325 [Bacteroides xylanisolvens]RHK29637.1 hypothetical protein DW075_01840 [Bacteroides xylanisolvens]